MVKINKVGSSLINIAVEECEGFSQQDCSTCQKKTMFGISYFTPDQIKCVNCGRCKPIPVSNEDDLPYWRQTLESRWLRKEAVDILNFIIKEHSQLQNEAKTKTQELQTEKENHQDFITTSQEWHERQKAEITEQKDQVIAEWKNKYTNFINSRKAKITQEITLLKNILDHE